LIPHLTLRGPQLVDAALLLRQYVNRRFWGAEAPDRAGATAGDLRRMQREAATQATPSVRPDG